jgi:DNA helicase-2/ATP-dependent DNA helicase PcrA
MISPLLRNLNPAQQQAIQAPAGPVLVLAGPGSGKTRVLTHRVAYLIEEAGVDPLSILAVTFTNKAAREMKERLANLVGPSVATELTVGTFHSLCARFLRRDIIHLGRERDFAIYDTDDQERLIKQVLRARNIDDKKNTPRSILGRISSAKNELVSPEEFASLLPHKHSYREKIVSDCYTTYQEMLRENNALDFDDLLMQTVRLFAENPDVLAWYHRRYIYLLVDEYQDTNHAQYMLVRHLAAKERNLFVVGDDDQSIYAWRGADIRNILQFETDYPDARVILLEQNYRSTRAILAIAQALIEGGTRGKGSSKRQHRKKLWTENGEGQQVSLIEGYDQNDEARCVAAEIARLLGKGTRSPGDIAVMYRTNAQSRALEEAFMTHGIAYQIVGGTRFYERKEVKDVLAYLRMVLNPYDSVSMERIINVPSRRIGKKTTETLAQWAASLDMSPYMALQELAEENDEARSSPFNSGTRKALLGFLKTIEELIALRQQLDLPYLIETLLERLRFRDALLNDYGSDEGDERWGNVQELRNVANDYIYLPREAQLPTFLEEVALVSDLDALDSRADTVTCTTLHQAKGLEFPVVFLLGLEEGILPHSRAIAEQDREKIEEERRLLYVGVTRAKEQLYLLYAFRRAMQGTYATSTPSRFLADIPPELLVRKKSEGKQPSAQTSMFSERGGYGRTSQGQLARAASRARSAARASSGSLRFGPGQRVRHRNYGEGVVVSSKPVIGGDEEVVVNFGARGQKRMLASFARLEHAE